MIVNQKLVRLPQEEGFQRYLLKVLDAIFCGNVAVACLYQEIIFQCARTNAVAVGGKNGNGLGRFIGIALLGVCNVIPGFLNQCFCFFRFTKPLASQP